MTQELKDTNVTETNHTSEKVGNGGLKFYVNSPEILEALIEIFENKIGRSGYNLREELEEYALVFKDKEFLEVSNRQKVLLYEMKHAKFIVIGAIDQIHRLLLRFITLLYGLCSSQSSNIFCSFFSSSLFRTPLVLN